MWTITFDHYTVIFKDTRIWTDSTVLEATIESLLPEAVTVQATATGPFAVIKNDTTFQDPWIAYAFVAQILRDWMHIETWATEGDYLWPEEAEPTTNAVFSDSDTFSGMIAGGGNTCHSHEDPLSYKASLASRVAKFSNTCHDLDGEFCSDQDEQPSEEPQDTSSGFRSADQQRPLNPKVPASYDEESKQWVAKLTPEEKTAAMDYTGSYLYGRINDAAVNGTPDPEVDALDSALAKVTPRETPIIAYRRASFQGEGAEERRDAYVASLKPGQEISLARPNSFQSASVTPRYPVMTGWPASTIMYEIKAKGGAAIGNVTEGGGTQKEKEILFPRDTKFKVVSVQKDVQFGPPPKKRGLGDTNKRLVVQVQEV